MSFLVVQSQSCVYLCDFEDEQENEQWILNAGTRGPDCANKWYIGEPGKNNGVNGLFVSSDEGLTTDYVNKGVSVVAYRIIQIPAGEYEVSFEWQANGMDSLDGVYACWIPEDVKTNSVNLSNLQGWVKQYAVSFDGNTRLYQKSWNTVSGKIVSDGTPYKLVFVWNNGVVGTYQPAVSIDNVMILAAGMCDKPTGLQIKPMGDVVRLSWSGNADKYDVKCYSLETKNWVYYNSVSDTFVDISGLAEGLCDYYVRAVCDEYFTSWVSHSQFLYYPSNRCIDYMSLTAENCFYGFFEDPAASKGVKDFGYQNKLSRHTLHYSKTERDPRTANQLRTVPDGEIASVRLGNWCTGKEAECVEFKYTVDADESAVLLLKYAVVLESPGHKEYEQPRFTLQVLRGKEPIDKEKGCGEADFVAGYTTDDGEWNQVGSVLWHDWTTVGINLKPYAGQTLTIRLTTYDCLLSGHYGYAYFVLGCSDGELKGMSCGTTPQNRFEGPDGFKYRWYLPDDPENILGEEQVFMVDAEDTLTYNLDVIQPTKPDCYYTLEVSSLPRFPLAEATYTAKIENCENVVEFDNTSYVSRINHVSGELVRTTEECESIRWDFGDGTISDEFSPTHVFPQDGGTYTVTLLAGISDDMCVDTLRVDVALPRLGTVYDTLRVDACVGDSYYFKGKYHFNSVEMNDTLLNRYMCDSIVTLYLTMHDKYDIAVYDTICSDAEYYFVDRLMTESGTYKDTLTSVFGCDSMVTLHIVVNEVLDCDVASEVAVCLGDDVIDIPYTLHSGLLTGFDIVFAESEVSGLNRNGLYAEPEVLRIPMTDSILPGTYHATIHFGEQSCGHDNVDVLVNVYYPSDVVVQRWNDVLAVQNRDYNGGYEFVSYQWYKDNVPIEGAIMPNYYVPVGLDTASQYSVLLTRADDGVSQFVCPFVPVYFTDLDDVTVNIYQGEDGVQYVKSSDEGLVRVWSCMGIVVDELHLSDGVQALHTTWGSGVYLLEIIVDGRTRCTEKIVVR